MAVAGYDILRNGTQIGTSNSTSYTDLTRQPVDDRTTTRSRPTTPPGNVSPASNTATITTPAPSNNPPVISNVATTGITSSSATITWTTDIPSSSQVLYGTSSSYTQSTTLDTTQVTSHSQTITGLTPSTTYHFAVQSTGSATPTPRPLPTTSSRRLPSNITLPDMQIKVPTNAISIGTNASNGDRQLQFTHITWDAGTGPFEIDPTYNSSTGTATWVQAIYKSTSPGNWTLDHTVPVAATGVFDPPFDYQFPLTKFTLNTVNADGSIGSLVATSPKTDYCITGDAIVGGVPNTPNQTYIPQSNCTDPTKPLGWSVGWGDEYDQTDNGQPIDLTGVADGTYILRGNVDPQHVLTESDPTNNVTDTRAEHQRQQRDRDLADLPRDDAADGEHDQPGQRRQRVRHGAASGQRVGHLAGDRHPGAVPARRPAAGQSGHLLAVHLQLEGGQHLAGDPHAERAGDRLQRGRVDGDRRSP